MDLQYIHNSQGKLSGIYIPIDLWELLKNKFKDLKKIESEDFSLELSSSFKQVKDMRDGKIPKQSLRSFLNEL